MPTRRRILKLLTALAASPALRPVTAFAQAFAFPHLRRKSLPPKPSTVSFIFFGTDTDNHLARGVYRCRFDSATGQLSPAELAFETPRAAYLAFGPLVSGRRCLYVTNELENASATLTALGMNPATGDLTLLNQVSSGGAGPAYVSVDVTGRCAFVADYAGSAIASYRIEPSGALSPPVERLDYRNPRFGTRGPNTARQNAPHPHSVHISPDNRFLLVSDLGSDEISVFAIHLDTARLGPPALFSNARPGSGPRHIAFHPNGRWVYSINELDSTIDQFLWTTTSSLSDPQGLLVKAGPPISTLAPDYPVARNTAAEVVVSPDGHFVYASNRGEDTLVAFSVSPSDGALTLLQRIPSGGRTPRQFTLDPSGNWLICGNQDSATVTVFHRDAGSGRLAGPTQTIPLDAVMCTLFA